MRRESTARRLVILLLVLLMVQINLGAAENRSTQQSNGAGEGFSVKRVGNLIPFNDNAFTITAPRS